MEKGAEKDATKDAEKKVADKPDVKSEKTEKQKVCTSYIYSCRQHKSVSVSLFIKSLWLVSTDYNLNKYTYLEVVYMKILFLEMDDLRVLAISVKCTMHFEQS